jgi:hypothetical protein
MTPFAMHLLQTIRAQRLTPELSAMLDSALADPERRYQPPVWSAWTDPGYFLVDLAEWTDGLEPRDLPPREVEFAKAMSRHKRTVHRWLQRAGMDGWEDFLQVHDLAGHNGVVAPTH